MIIGLIIILVGIIIMFYHLFLSINNHNEPHGEIKDNPSICIVIPARDESKVIKNILDSIEKQTYQIDMKDVYIIVEDQKDKTVSIAEEYNATILYRKTNRKRKGYALDEGIKDILKIKEYDLYFIFDADNILDKNFIKYMLKSYYKGYDIAVGYRNSKNGNDNVITSCSTLTFSMINQLFNDSKVKHQQNVTISGTGFYISGYYINKWQGYPFYTLTEDYELTLYSILNNLSSDYNKKAIFYDEQPKKMKISISQRTRWVKGFFEARKKYIPLIKQNLNNKTNKGSKISNIYFIRDIIVIVIGILYLLFYNLIFAFYNFVKTRIIISNYLINVLIILMVVYISLSILTIIILIKEEKQLNLSFKTKLITILFNPIFLFTYLICVYKAILNKDIEWKKIEHSEICIK